MAEKKGRLRWLGFKRETSASSIKWELGGAVWLHDKRQEGGARRIIAAVHLLFWTAAIGYDLDTGQEKPHKIYAPTTKRNTRERGDRDEGP